MAIKLKRRQARKTATVNGNGPEPTIVDESNYTRALNWYSNEMDAEQARKYLVAYMKANDHKSNEIARIKAIPKDKVVTTAGWIARIMTNGNAVADSTLAFFNTRLDQMLQLGAEIRKEKRQEAKASGPTMTIQERLIEKSKVIAGEVDAEVIDERKPIYDYLIANEVVKPTAEFLLDYYRPFYNEVMSNDPAIKEQFENLRIERKYWKSVIEDLERYVTNRVATKKVRKPRRKKVKDAVDLAKGMNFQKSDPSLKLESVDPANIVGAQQVWLFNTSRLILARINARGPAGLSISRSSIKGIDEETSIQKSARRNTEQVLNDVLTGGKIKLRKIMEEINALESASSGRVNDNTIILRVVK